MSPGRIILKAKGRTTRREPGVMNGLERKYAAYLDERKAAGEIADWKFEAIKLRLAKNTTYSPDFTVMHLDGVIEFIEVKGFWEDDARVKIKVAAEVHWWFTFTAIKAIAKKRGGGWCREEF